VKYLLMIYGNREKWESMPPDAWPGAIARQEAFNAKYRETGELLGSYGLADGRAADYQHPRTPVPAQPGSTAGRPRAMRCWRATKGPA
jgi:hypothetical protein